MTLDVAGALRDAWAMMKRDREILFAVGGVFILLPEIAQAMFVASPPAPPKSGADQAAWQAWLDTLSVWAARNDPLLVALAVLTTFGTLCLLLLYADRARPDVVTALRRGMTLAPMFLLLALSVAVPVNLGVLLLLLPGLYLKGRLFAIGPAFVAERPLGVFAAWRRSFALTRGHGLVLMALACVPLLVGNVLAWPLEAIGQLADGLPMANPVVAALIDIASASVRTAAAVAATLIEIAVYRRLSSGT